MAQKFVLGCGGGGFQVSTMSNLNPSCIELDLGLGLDNIRTTSIKKQPSNNWGFTSLYFTHSIQGKGGGENLFLSYLMVSIFPS